MYLFRSSTTVLQHWKNYEVIIILTTKNTIKDNNKYPEGLESIIKEVSPFMTGLLKVTFDACDGFIAIDRGVIIDGYELYNDELLVKDRHGRHIIERYETDPGRVAVYEVQPEVVHTFLRTLQEDLPQDFRAWFSHLCSNRGRNGRVN